MVELAIGFGEVLVLAFALVFPGEMAAFPDVDEAEVALGAAGGGGEGVDGFVEAVVVAGGVGFDGVFDAEEEAEVVEVGLGGGFFGEGRVGPFRDELIGGHGGDCREGEGGDQGRREVMNGGRGRMTQSAGG